MHELFGLKHLIIVGVCIVAVVGLFFGARKMKLAKVCNIMFIIGIVSEIIKLFYYTVTNEDKFGGVLPKTDLPFHLCSIQIIFFAVLNFAKSDNLKRFLLSFMVPSCLVGGAAAILIATESSLNGLWIISLQYFTYHACLVAFAVYLLAAKQIKLCIKDYFNCFKFILALMFFAIYINSMVYDGESDINFMYVAGPPVDGLPFLTEKYGWLVYIAHYASLIVVCITLVYIKPIIDAIKEALAKKNEAKAVALAEVAATSSEEREEVNE